MKETSLREKDYSAFIVDMDGTLYYKHWMQIQVLLHLICYYMFRIHRLKELLILYSYRKLRDRAELADIPDLDQVIIGELSRRYQCSEAHVQQTINDWILFRPLKMLRVARDRCLIAFINKQLSENKKVFIYSDYPAIRKCETLGVCASNIYWPDTIRISVLKPSSAGLKYILEDNQLPPSEVLFIGDRMEKDGKCAIDAGVDYLILKKSYFLRKIQYRQLAKIGGIIDENTIKS